MEPKFVILPLFVASLFQAGQSSEISGREILDQDGKYEVSWVITPDTKTIYFNVSAETKGYVGFGLSPNGGMQGADIFIAGKHANGTNYSSDRYAEKNEAPKEDESQDWVLDSADETETHTHLSFHRKLNTCDDKDFEITDSTIRIIWAMGTSDVIEYHVGSRGTKSVNFYLTNEDDFPRDEFTKLDITVDYEMPAEHTTYWCTIHKLPTFTEPRHIVAFEPILENPDALAHTHHYIFHRCIAPEGADPDEFFGPWTSHPGDLCYGQTNASFPFHNYCNGNMVYTWTKGGKGMIFPDNMGFNITDDINKPVYYTLEVHYDNPQKLVKKFKTGGRIYHTDKLREIEVGLMVIEHHTSVQLTIPPLAENYVVSGHCSSECTNEILPEDGITIFNSMLHAHLTGRKIKLRHFRGELELEWVDKDDYYDFDFQQNKPLSKERQVFKGDQLTVECTFDTSGVEDGLAVVGGLSSHEEMCQSWVFYYPRLENAAMCGSEQDLDKHFELFGVTEKKEGESEFPGGLEEWEIVKPDHLAGKYRDSISKKVNWTTEFRTKYQDEKRFGYQIGTCGARMEGNGIRKSGGVVKYPVNLKEYVPINECPSQETEPTTVQENSSTSPLDNGSSQQDGGSTTPQNDASTTDSSAVVSHFSKFVILIGICSLFL